MFQIILIFFVLSLFSSTTFAECSDNKEIDELEEYVVFMQETVQWHKEQVDLPQEERPRTRCVSCPREDLEKAIKELDLAKQELKQLQQICQKN